MSRAVTMRGGDITPLPSDLSEPPGDCGLLFAGALRIALFDRCGDRGNDSRTLGYGDAGAIEVPPDGLVAPAEALREKPLGDRKERQARSEERRVGEECRSRG